MSTDATKYVAYYRVSTQRQGVSGLGLEAQHAAVEAYISQHGGTLLASYQEIESGGKANRPQLIVALEHCRLTRAVLVVAKMDRLTRDVSFLCRLRDSGVEFFATDNPTANKLTVTMMVAVAEEERRLISERTKAALAATRARGVRLGNPRGVAAFGSRAGAGGPEAVRAKALKLAQSLSGIVLPLYDQGVSLRGIATALNDARIPAPRGGAWRPGGVQRVIARLRPAGAPEVGQDALPTAADAPESRAPGSCTEVAMEDPEDCAEAVRDAREAESSPAVPETSATVSEPVWQNGTGTALEDSKTEQGAAQATVRPRRRRDYLAEVQADGLALERVPRARKTPEICLAAVRQAGRALQFVPRKLKTPELCMEAVRQNGLALYDVPGLIKTPEMCLEAMQRGGTLWSVPQRLRTPEICAAAKAAAAEAASETPKATVAVAEATEAEPVAPEMESQSMNTLLTPEACLEAVRQGVFLWRVPEHLRSEEICHEAVRHDGFALAFVPEALRTSELCMEAVRQNPRALEHVPEELKTPEFCAEAVRLGWRALEFVPKHLLPEFCLATVKQDGAALELVPEELKVEEICREAVRQMPLALEFVPEKLKTRKFCVEAVEQNGCALKYVPERFRTPELCLEAVRDNAYAMEGVPDRLKTPDLCLEAVRHCGWAFKFVPEALKTPEFCLEAVKANGQALEFVPERFKTPELCLAAVQAPRSFWGDAALKHVPEALKTPELCAAAVQADGRAAVFVTDAMKTPELFMAAVRQCGKALECMPDAAKTPEICLAAVEQDGMALESVPEHLMTPEVCLAAVRQDGLALLVVPEALKTEEICLAAMQNSYGVVLDSVPDALKAAVQAELAR